MNLLFYFYEYGCGLWASSGPFPLLARQGLYKRGRDPPTNPSRHLKKERVILHLKWLLKEGQGGEPTAATAAATAAAPVVPPPCPPLRPPPSPALPTVHLRAAFQPPPPLQPPQTGPTPTSPDLLGRPAKPEPVRAARTGPPRSRPAQDDPDWSRPAQTVLNRPRPPRTGPERRHPPSDIAPFATTRHRPAQRRSLLRAPSLTRPGAPHRCRARRPPSPRPTGLAPRRLGIHSPLSYFEVLYFLQYFPHLSPPPSDLVRLSDVWVRDWVRGSGRRVDDRASPTTRGCSLSCIDGSGRTPAPSYSAYPRSTVTTRRKVGCLRRRRISLHHLHT